MCVKRAQDPSPPSWLIDDSWIFHKKKSRQQEIADMSRETLRGRRSEASKKNSNRKVLIAHVDYGEKLIFQ